MFCSRFRAEHLKKITDIFNKNLLNYINIIISCYLKITVQAFEDAQEQNVRLVKTLREKDDAHLKLMAERMKTAQLARLLKEDKQLLEEQIRLMQAKIEALNRAVLKQEEKVS